MDLYSYLENGQKNVVYNTLTKSVTDMNKRQRLILIIAAVALLLASSIDIITPPGYLLSSFYIIPILIVTFTFGPQIIIAMTAVAILISSIIGLAFEHYSHSVLFFQIIGFIIIGFLAVRVSIERRKNQEIAEQMQLFTHMISHDVTQPITSMQLYIQLLSQKAGKQTRDHIEKITHSLSTMQNLIRDLQDITQMRRGEFAILPKKMNLYPHLSELVKEKQKETKAHTLVLHCPKRMSGYWDAIRLRQVINNLLTNAIKYSKKGEIEINVIKQDSRMSLAITDEGDGISPAQKEIIFQAFTRVGSNKAIRGSGLGLYISKIIVEKHGGSIWVESQMGKGSTFFVNLPLSGNMTSNDYSTRSA